jgi:hypothetical protein
MAIPISRATRVFPETAAKLKSPLAILLAVGFQSFYLIALAHAPSARSGVMDVPVIVLVMHMAINIIRS